MLEFDRQKSDGGAVLTLRTNKGRADPGLQGGEAAGG